MPPKAALALAEHWQPDIDLQSLNNASWAVVSRPDGRPDQYKVALQQAEVICRHDPQNGYYLNTLGVALYRVGRYQKAVDTLLRADKTNRGIPADLPFLAMAQHRLGQKEQAQATLARLRQTIQTSQRAATQETQAFLREAVELIEGPDGRQKE
jgi:tetratricopeptide (TPR) repeat protein